MVAAGLKDITTESEPERKKVRLFWISIKQKKMDIWPMLQHPSNFPSGPLQTVRENDLGLWFSSIRLYIKIKVIQTSTKERSQKVTMPTLSTTYV